MTAHEINLADLDFTVDPNDVKLRILARRLGELRRETETLMLELWLNPHLADTEARRRYDADEDEWLS